jgi:hypothetical protein
VTTHGDGSWRRSTLITHHIDHPPQVKGLVDELFETLIQGGRGDYEAKIEAEYASPGERVRHYDYGDGVLSLIAVPGPDADTMHLTHLVYGGCTTHQIRQDLVERGLGSLGITWVYPPDAVLPDDDS